MYNKNKSTLSAVWLLMVSVAILSSYAQAVNPLAVDSPTNYTTSTWTNGANMGSGFTPWEFTNTAPKIIPPAEIFNVDAENWAPQISWNVMSTTNGTSSAFRGFQQLEIGDQIYTKFKIDSVADIASRVGFRLYQGANLLYFAQYEDENNSWNLNNSMSWTRSNPLAVTEFIWGRSGTDQIDIIFKYEGSTVVGVTGSYWTNSFPDRIEIFSEYQGIDTGGIGLLELSAPAIVPEANTKSLLLMGLFVLATIQFLLNGKRKNWNSPNL